MVRRNVGAACSIVVLACGGGVAGSKGTADSAARVVSLDTAAKAGSGAHCPMWGLWQRCNVEERLVRAGMVVMRGDEPVLHDFMHVPGLVYRTGVSEIQIFLYASAAERERDTAPLDTTSVAPAGSHVVWKEPPTLVTSNNLAAIVLSLNERQAERIADALGAGLPQHDPRGRD